MFLDGLIKAYYAGFSSQILLSNPSYGENFLITTDIPNL